jgi:hypothetical protein
MRVGGTGSLLIGMGLWWNRGRASQRLAPRVGVLGKRLRGDCNVAGGASRGAVMGTLGGIARRGVGALGGDLLTIVDVGVVRVLGGGVLFFLLCLM